MEALEHDERITTDPTDTHSGDKSSSSGPMPLTPYLPSPPHPNYTTSISLLSVLSGTIGLCWFCLPIYLLLCLFSLLRPNNGWGSGSSLEFLLVGLQRHYPSWDVRGIRLTI